MKCVVCVSLGLKHFSVVKQTRAHSMGQVACCQEMGYNWFFVGERIKKGSSHINSSSLRITFNYFSIRTKVTRQVISSCVNSHPEKRGQKETAKVD